ncbi:WG repeat-containing protein [Chitinophaga silvatica]|uniref:WG repeat-containing protein n=1 Tax=Chitinophaga silvatica TaxID=2282649 RepID=A0A3E1YGD0_9BACT|nr:WG repeat-containing protein [Chitinophaga silvatica]RFS26426.1 WG repeat-containing protein [Chitinophaga silvatica]
MRILSLTASVIVAALCLSDLNAYSQIGEPIYEAPAYSSSEHKLLVPFLKGKLWGFSDVNKKMVIQPTFEKVEFFSESGNMYYAKGELNGEKIIISETGKYMKDDTPGYEEILMGSGLISGYSVSSQIIKKDDNLDKNGLHGYTYDAENNVLITSGYYDSFIKLINKGKLALAKNKNQKIGLVDPGGKVIIPFEYDKFIGSIGRGNDLLILEKDKKMGIFDLTGKIQLPFEFDKIEKLEGYGNILLLTKNTKTSTESFLVNAFFMKLYDGVLTDAVYSNGLIRGAKDGKYGYINTDGTVVVPFKYKKALPFAERPAISGFALVTNMDGVSYFINQKGVEYYSEK